MTDRQNTSELAAELEELRARLGEAEETPNAIRTGEVDALVVQGPAGHAVYTLTSAERVYRLLVEAMNEGALVLAPDGSIIYSNQAFAAMLGLPLEQVIGSTVFEYVAEPDKHAVKDLLNNALWTPGRREIALLREDAVKVPAHISVGGLDVEESDSISAVVTDLTEHKQLECELEKYREHLEDLVEERTMQLRQTVEQLKVEIEARKKAEAEVSEANEELQNASESLAAANASLLREIEERQTIELALRGSEERFRGLVTATSDVLYRMNPDWSEMRQLRGGGFLADTEKPNPNWLQEYIHPQDQAHVLEVINEAIRARSTFEMEHRVLRIDGSVGWTFSRAVPLRDADGEVVEWFGTASDITDRKEMEASLRDSQQDLKRAQAVARVGSWRLNVHRNELLWSDEAYRMFGIANGTPMTYHAFLACVHPDDRDYVNSRWQSALRGELYDIEHRIVVRDTVKWIHENAELEFDEEGALLGGFGTAQDVTEQVEHKRRMDELFEREHWIAETLQQAMMPAQLPSVIDGWTLAARYQPALQEALVGGDFYDVFRLDDGRVGILIGDVAGKGLAASIRVAGIRHSIRSYAYVNDSPARIVQLANDVLCREDIDERNMLTAFFAILDLQTHSMTYANAGHEPPVVQTAGGDVTELDVTGPMFGICVGTVYFERTIQLEPGDSIILLTDGITEARTPDSVLFEKEGVMTHLTKVSNASPDQIAETLLQAATLHAQGNLQDDVAIVVIGSSKGRRT